MIKKEFPSYSNAEWTDKTTSDLKGKAFDSLLWKTGEGFTLNPFYTKEETNKVANAFPRRTTHNYLDSWTIIQGFFEGNREKLNTHIIEALESGTQGIVIEGMANAESYDDILQGVSLEMIEFYLRLNQREKRNQLLSFKTYLDNINVVKGNSKGNRIKGGLQYDPLNEVLDTGSWGDGKNAIVQELKEVIDLTADIDGFHALNLDGAKYGDAGATIVNELAYTLSLVNEYLLLAADNEQEASNILDVSTVTLSIGRSYLMEIAKVKVFRILLENLIKQYGIEDHRIRIISRSSGFECNDVDEYSNLLRLTSQAMSAIIGGADGIILNSFQRKEDAFSQRMSRNIQLMLLEESNFSKGIDVSAGSYSIEKIIQELAAASWSKFQSIEAEGGWIRSVESGQLQADIHKDAEQKASELNDKTRTSIGLNAYLDDKSPIWKSVKVEKMTNSEIQKLSKIVHNFE